MAASKVLSNAQSNESSSRKKSLHLFGVRLLVKIMQFGPSLLHLRSIISKNRRVFSMSKMLLPISSIIRHDGLTSPDIALLSVPVLRAFVNFSFRSVAFMK